jgi:AraC-like DNA-binding protein/FixJ family two-component response regulator
MRVSKPVLLWVDCTSGLPDASHRIRCGETFEIVLASGLQQVEGDIARHRPSAICFEFDYPDQARLHAMRAVKQSHARLPVLMLTLEHSEQLAIWAFRAKVWNYLVKPVSPAEMSENLRALAGVCSRATPPRTVQMVAAALPANLRGRPIPPEVALLQPALDHVAQHYHERVTASAAARTCGLDRFEFSKKFRAAFGMTFREYLLRARVNEACRFLASGSLSVTGVAYSVGFNDGSHFARIFKRFTGVLPSGYRDRSLAEGHGQRRRSSDGPDVSASCA